MTGHPLADVFVNAVGSTLVYVAMDYVRARSGPKQCVRCGQRLDAHRPLGARERGLCADCYGQQNEP